MKTLFSLNLKKNNGILYNNKKNLIVKFYTNTTSSSKRKILNEFKGYTWYFKTLSKKNQKKFFLKKNVNTLFFSAFKGEKYSPYNSMIFKTSLLQKIIDHYNFIWPKKNKVPFHGDLTFENVIFLKNDKVKFIDWEFFEDKQDWGLDLCYFLISVIVLPAISSGKKKIDIDELNIFKLYWKKIFYKKNFTYLKDPISFMKKNIYHQNHFFYKMSDIMKNQINKSIL